MICYKTSYQQDPMYGKHDDLVTSDWREPPHAEPESSLTGTLYESNPVTADYVVVAPDSWVFQGTGARVGTRVRGLVGDEYDRVNPELPGAQADRDPRAFAVDLPWRAQLLGYRLLHP